MVISAFAGTGGYVVADCKNIRMIRTERARLLREQHLEQPQRFARISAFVRPNRNIIEGSENVRVIGTEYMLLNGKQFLEQP